MLWHIAKRELYDNMNSLRFVLAMLLILTLMVVNAAKHRVEYRNHTARHRRQIAQSRERLRSHADNLYDLVENGPGDLYKRPSALSFCANGGEASLPDRVSATGGDYLIGWL